MVWTAGSAFIIASVVFAILSFRDRTLGHATYTASELAKLDRLFWITPLYLIPLLVLVVLSIRKVPTALAVLFSAILAGVLAPLLQPQAVLSFVNDPSLSHPLAHIKGSWSALAIVQIQAFLKLTVSSHEGTRAAC